MEGDNNIDMSGGSSGVSLSSSRWIPTKEQINMLESLYRQGIRTPTAEQILQITGRLRALGHIQGKNVFYWFQNHKARQRQKQKQERIAFINRCLHKAHPNIFLGPYFLPRSDLGFYPQNPGGSKRRSSSRTDRESMEENTSTCCAGSGYDDPLQQEYNIMMDTSNNNEWITVESNYQNCDIDRETLDLFPLHPTGILQGRNCTSIEDGVSENPNFFDFFSGKSRC